eukprot:206214-Amphidinium_carterae.1
MPSVSSAYMQQVACEDPKNGTTNHRKYISKTMQCIYRVDDRYAPKDTSKDGAKCVIAFEIVCAASVRHSMDGLD